MRVSVNGHVDVHVEKFDVDVADIHSQAMTEEAVLA
jgi:hypothetical protein